MMYRSSFKIQARTEHKGCCVYTILDNSFHYKESKETPEPLWPLRLCGLFRQICIFVLVLLLHVVLKLLAQRGNLLAFYL